MAKTVSLTEKDLEVLEILWDSPVPMTAAEIVKQREYFTVNTVQSIVRKLLKHKLIQIDSIVYSGTVLTRCYRPAMSRDEFAASKFISEAKKLDSRISKTALVAALLDAEDSPQKALEEIRQLEAMLEEYKKKL
ncbi:MAG: BlaI/MecI/CopY family transcriptional regulator [Eubacteriales bacterium]|nr:BlaI/MecI/CopY family transcriptional regulator [Eubacteriales bacterium]